MKLHFEQLQEQDVALLRDISEEYANVDIAQVKPFLAEKHNIALVAKLDGKIIGLLCGHSLTDFEGGTRMFYIYSVDIHSEYQNRGYCSQFMQFAIDWAKGNGFRNCCVYTDEDNKRACRVYEKVGMTSIPSCEFNINFSENE